LNAADAGDYWQPHFGPGFGAGPQQSGFACVSQQLLCFCVSQQACGACAGFGAVAGDF
jgi:hypothetical protein